MVDERVLERWREISFDIPSLLPLQPAPQTEEQVIPYIQALHNYLAEDRLKVARAINIANYFRMLPGTTAQLADMVAQNTKNTTIDEDTLLMSIDSSVKSGSPAWEPVTAGNVYWSQYTQDPTGFAVTAKDTNGGVTLGISGSNFTIAPYDGSSWRMFFRGREIIKTAQETLSLSAATTEGNWYIYYSYDDATDTASLVLDDSVTFEDIIRDNIFVAELYHDGTSLQFMVRETHGLMPWSVHYLWHQVLNTAYLSGLGLTGMTVDGNGSLDAHAEVDAASGVIADEDINHSLATMNGNWDILYRTSGKWTFENTGANSPVKLLTGVPQWNDVSVSGSEVLSNVTNNKYFLIHVLATGIETDGSGTAKNGHVAILGQGEYNSAADAREAANSEASNLITTSLPMPEFLFVGSIICRYSSAYSNSYKTIFVSTDEGDDYVSWIGSALQPGSAPGAHDSLTNRDLADSHPASAISVVTTGFSGELSSADDEVQQALDTLDAHDHASGLSPLRVDDNSETTFRRYINVVNDYNAGSSGCIAIRPFGNSTATTINTMVRLTIHGHEHRSGKGAFEIQCSAYWAGSIPSWNSASTYSVSGQLVSGEIDFTDRIRFARDSNGYPIILIGDTADTHNLLAWSADIQVSYTGASAYDPADTTFAYVTSLASFTTDQDVNPISSWAGLAPSTAAVSNTTGSTVSTSYATIASGSSGPYIIHLIQNTDASASGTFKLTVDGTQLFEESTVFGDVVVGAQADKYACSIFARSSFTLEAKDIGPDMDYRVVYQQVSTT